MSDERPAAVVKDLYKSFRLPHEQHNGIKQLIVNFFKRKKGYEVQHVLEDISFEIKKGEFFGIVGRNGSGKSTLLKLLAGIYTADRGLVRINGSLTPFIELGVGFNPELTGRENVFMNGALLGFGRDEMEKMYDEIVEFAELDRFMDQKLKNYSSGMQVRLAFSIAIRARSDILLLDEVLAVGDALFQKKCYDYFKKLKKDKRTVIFVSHDTNALQEYCDRAILVDSGRIVRQGNIDVIVRDYLDLLHETEDSEPEKDEEEVRTRWGTGKAEVEAVRIGGGGKKVFKEEEDIQLSVTYRAKTDLPKPVLGITITDATGHTVFQSNTLWCQQPVEDLRDGKAAEVRWVIPNSFNSGTYSVAPAVADHTGTEIYDWVEAMAEFEVRKKQKSHGCVNVLHGIITRYEN